MYFRKSGPDLDPIMEFNNPEFDNPEYGLPPSDSEPSGPKKTKSKPKTIKSCFDRWAGVTTMHAIPDIWDAEHAARKGIWIALYFICLILAWYTCYEDIKSFAEFGTTTSVEVSEKRPMTMPVVTICNRNPLKKSKYHDPEFDNKAGGMTPSEEKAYFLKLEAKIAQGDPQTTAALASIDDMVVECHFDGSDCIHSTHWKTFVTPRYGTCLQFNHDENQLIHDHVERHGLQLVLNANAAEYLPSSEAVGFKINFHHKDRLPGIENEGVTVMPGHETYIGLTMREHNRASAPYGRCLPELEGDQGNRLFAWNRGDFPHARYSSAACLQTCEQANIMKTCQCILPDGTPVNKIEAKKYFRFDDLWRSFDDLPSHMCSDEERCCIDSVRIGLSSDRGNCHRIHCSFEQCKDTYYDDVISESEWPSNHSLPTIVKKFGHVATGLDEAHVKENLAAVVIYYREFNVVVTSLSPLWSVPGISSFIGGALGLWIGLSILGAFGLIELFLEVLRVCFQKIVFY